MNKYTPPNLLDFYMPTDFVDLIFTLVHPLRLSSDYLVAVDKC
jgi:hypothetical protein